VVWSSWGVASLKCETCSKPSEVFVEYTGIGFCKKCYERLLFKRLKTWFRNHEVINKKKTHVLLDDSSLGFLFLQEFFKKFFSYPGLKWVVRKRVTSRTRNKIIILPTTLTQETDDFIHAVLNNEDYNSGLHEKNVFKPLTCFLETDLLKWKRKRKVKPKHPDAHKFVEEVVKRRPMTRFSTLKHLEEF
jgi:hypothetical protein